MKVIVAGSRTIGDLDLVEKAIADSGFKIDELVWGCAPGVDTLAKIWADNSSVPSKPFPADWIKYGRKNAGKIRNQEMANYADALVAVREAGGKSKGTTDMIKRMKTAGKPVFLVDI